MGRQIKFVNGAPTTVEIPDSDDPGINWNAPDGNAPVEIQEYNENIFLFSPDVQDNQFLYAYVKVPERYVEGNQIKMYGGVYTPSSPGSNILMKTRTYLYRPETDVMDSVTNFHNSTNTEITNETRKFHNLEFDLTDSNGKINSISVSAGDVLKIRLNRQASTETSSDTADTRFMPNMCELSFG